MWNKRGFQRPKKLIGESLLDVDRDLGTEVKKRETEGQKNKRLIMAMAALFDDPFILHQKQFCGDFCDPYADFLEWRSCAFRLPIPTSANQMTRVLNGQAVASPVGVYYKKRIRLLLAGFNVPMVDETEAMSLEIKTYGLRWDADIDNLFKFTQDAISVTPPKPAKKPKPGERPKKRTMFDADEDVSNDGCFVPNDRQFVKIAAMRCQEKPETFKDNISKMPCILVRVDRITQEYGRIPPRKPPKPKSAILR